MHMLGGRPDCKASRDGVCARGSGAARLHVVQAHGGWASGNGRFKLGFCDGLASHVGPEAAAPLFWT